MEFETGVPPIIRSTMKKLNSYLLLAAKLFGMLLICFAVNILIDLFLKDGWHTVIKDTLVQAIIFWAVIIYQHLKKRC